jgi:Tol biopolymer transport system component
MKRVTALATIAGLTLLGLVAVTGPTQAKAPGPSGRIAFFSNNAGDNQTNVAYTVNPDGGHKELLFAKADHPHWSPDGSELSVSCDACGAATIIDADTGTYRVLQSPDPRLPLGCGPWSPDGRRLACQLVDDVDPSLAGIYTIRSSDGGGLTKVTGIRGAAGDYSPDGKRLVFETDFVTGELQLYVIKLNGSGLTPITPPGMALSDENAGSWSPSGNEILFQARPAPDDRFALWVVSADGSGLRELPIPGCGGAFSDPLSIGCGDPVWSPDGSKIAFSRFSSKARQKNIYAVNPDGSALFQVTRTGSQDFGPDWGPHPLAT